MNNYIKKNISIILSIFLLLSPILDLITGIMIKTFNINLTIGIIVRLLELLFIFLTCIFIYNKKKLLIPYILVGAYTLLYLIGYNSNNLIINLHGLLRVMYFPLILISLFSIKDEFNISENILKTVLYEYLLLIFIPNILGLGYETYSVAKIGNLGYFLSANEISGIIAIITPFLFMNVKERIIPKILIMIIYIYVILNIGTKTPILSLGITLFLILIYELVKQKRKKKYKIIFSTILTILILTVSLIIYLPKTNFYKNINIHLNYLKVDEITDLKEYKIIDHFIFSSRLKFKKNKEKLYNKSLIYNQIVGIGYIKDGKRIKDVEMDGYDIAYSHGLLGMILFYGIFIYVYIKRKERLRGFNKLLLNISILLILLLSFITGHIMTSPSLGLLISIILLYKTSNKKELLFASYSMDLGGIEKALLNLTNRIDKDKYNVTIILEKKEGIFLDKINKFINVQELKVSDNKNLIFRKAVNLLRKELFRLFNYKKYDFSCCYATYSYSSNVLALLSSSNNSIYIHSNYKHVYEEKEFKNFFETRNINKFKHVLVVSDEIKQSLKEFNLNNILVFNNFIDTEEIITLSKEKINIEKDKKNKTLVFVGRLDDKSKKLGRAISIIKEIENTKLIIVGDGEDKKLYTSLVDKNNLKEKVLFVGKKSNPYPYMELADYIILTSDYEGFPVAYLEAIALNKKIITTFPTSDDSINIKKLGFVVSANNIVKDTKKILKENKLPKYPNIERIQKNRMKKLEEVFNEVENA